MKKIKNQTISIRVGDKVQIISGSEKNKKGEVIKVNKKTGQIIVKGINKKIKHVKPRTENEIGEINSFEAPIHCSNVILILN